MPRVCRHTRTRGASPREPGSTGIGAQRIGRPLDHGRARLLALLALSGRAAFLAPQKGARARPRRPALSQCKVLVGGRARKSLEPQSTPPLGRHRPPEDRLGQHGRALQASRSRTWARSTSSSTTRWMGIPRSTRCSPAPTLKYGRDQEWVCALRTRSIRDTGVCLGFLGSSGGHAAVSYFVCAKPTALGGVS